MAEVYNVKKACAIIYGVLLYEEACKGGRKSIHMMKLLKLIIYFFPCCFVYCSLGIADHLIISILCSILWMIFFGGGEKGGARFQLFFFEKPEWQTKAKISLDQA